MGSPSTIMATAVLLATLARADDPLLVRRAYQAGVMGTSLEIVAFGTHVAATDAAILAAETEIRRIEDLMTDWRPSPLMTLNAHAGGGPHAVPHELAAIIARAKAVSELTHGAFDPTFASVGQLWDFKAKPPVVPNAADITNALIHVGAWQISVDADAATVTLPAKVRVGLGGIAKGYAVDRAISVLRDRGIANAMVNAGGDMKVLGKDGDQPWEVAVKHPREHDRALAVLHLSNTCLLTSGDYERFFEVEGQRYHHILDPRTGYSATGCMSASVVAQNAEFADALATALCVLPPEDGLALVESLPRVEAILVDLDGHVHASSGLRDRLLP